MGAVWVGGWVRVRACVDERCLMLMWPEVTGSSDLLAPERRCVSAPACRLRIVSAHAVHGRHETVCRLPGRWHSGCH